MIMLCGINNIDAFTFDVVYYATHTCPKMGPGCEHHPELAASTETCKLCYPPYNDMDEFYRRYEEEMRSEPRYSHLKDLVRRSDAGEWIQLIFYETDPNEGERPYLYKILKELTNNVTIQ